MFGQFDVNHEIALKHYNALFCNQTHRQAIQAYLEALGAGQGLLDWQYGNYLTDAALECCGHEFYNGSVMTVLALAGERGADVYAAALRHLENFATLDHIATLELVGSVK